MYTIGIALLFLIASIVFAADNNNTTMERSAVVRKHQPCAGYADDTVLSYHLVFFSTSFFFCNLIWFFYLSFLLSTPFFPLFLLYLLLSFPAYFPLLPHLFCPTSFPSLPLYFLSLLLLSFHMPISFPTTCFSSLPPTLLLLSFSTSSFLSLPPICPSLPSHFLFLSLPPGVWLLGDGRVCRGPHVVREGQGVSL